MINNAVSHCFPVNFNPSDPEVEGVPGVLEAYNRALNGVALAGPTLFQHILAAMAGRIKACMDEDIKRGVLTYHTLLILTDGLCNDMADTIDRIIDLSYLPISIIIVGVGMADFSSMEFLDADDKPLIGYNGRVVCKRDIVQFVPFLNFASNAQLLSSETLKEIPRQIVEHYAAKGV